MLNRRTWLASALGLPACLPFLRGKGKKKGSDRLVYDWRQQTITEGTGEERIIVPMGERHSFSGGLRIYLDGKDISELRVFNVITGDKGHIYYYPLNSRGFMTLLDDEIKKAFMKGHVQVVPGAK